MPVRWVLVVALVAALLLLTVLISPIAALTFLVLAWSRRARWQLWERAYCNEPHDKHRGSQPPSSPHPPRSS